MSQIKPSHIKFKSRRQIFWDLEHTASMYTFPPGGMNSWTSFSWDLNLEALEYRVWKLEVEVLKQLGC